MKGQCLCGEIIFEVELKNHKVHVCHCGICRKQTSGIIMTLDIQPDSLKFTQKNHLAIYASSDWGERGFCSQCGTNLFWRTKDHSYCNINVFSLDQTVEDLTLDTEIYIDCKPEFYNFQNQTKKMTEADVIALFNSQSN